MRNGMPSNPNNVITNISQIHGNIVQAAKVFTTMCNYIYDSSLKIEHKSSNGIFASLLNVNDTFCRLLTALQGISAPLSFGISVFHDSNTCMSMGIKKMVHITLYKVHISAIFPLDYALGNRTNFANNSIDLPYDAVLCELIMAKYELNGTARISQAA